MLHVLLVWFVQSMLGAIVAGFVTGITYGAKQKTHIQTNPLPNNDERPTPEWVVFVFCGFWGLFTGALIALQRSGLIGA
ncbi:MAG: hypothetical protein HUU55_22335 [Myxococcales bacterium]|nr:hypothetical protein [Myxococcales bacterium]